MYDIIIKNPISEDILLKKIKKFGNRNNRPRSIRVYHHIYSPNEIRETVFLSNYSLKENRKGDFVEKMFDLSINKNIVGLNTKNLTLNIIISPIKDYRYSNITANVIDSIIKSIDW